MREDMRWVLLRRRFSNIRLCPGLHNYFDWANPWVSASNQKTASRWRKQYQTQALRMLPLLCRQREVRESLSKPIAFRGCAADCKHLVGGFHRFGIIQPITFERQFSKSRWNPLQGKPLCPGPP